MLRSGEIVTERELRTNENRFDGPAPMVGDFVEVECRGRKFTADVLWGNWSGREHPADTIVPLRVAEIGYETAGMDLRALRREQVRNRRD
ncbi:hypothetical protein [Komagataeibacter sp. FXV3]|uniref:hypothetical protein n=1 Tax=Komagataeibacter sp. FXV3 TaxID=2608998 RepID=UPI00187B67E9|nr:hypothetical protein [Komagataeibacter sp. FXV3]MBE7728544.1 hypothetical protein [Komagataeibacter sp. FXV3]